MYSNQILVAKISLHYESRPDVLTLCTREEFANILADRKAHKCDMNYYYKRVSWSKGVEIAEQTARNEARKEYDKKIMDKYKVGPNYRENRWFIEQVRPTI